MSLKKGDVVEVYESDNEQGWSLVPEEISVKWYKRTLWNVVAELLTTAGMPNVDELKKEFGITKPKPKPKPKPKSKSESKSKSKSKKKKTKEDGHNVGEPSRGVAELANNPTKTKNKSE
jgi:hypothetical protein